MTEEISSNDFDEYTIEEIDDSNGIIETCLEDDENGESLYTCDICNLSFTSIDNHVQEYHSGQKVLVQIQNEDGSYTKGFLDYDENKSIIKEEKLDNSILEDDNQDEENGKIEYIDSEFNDMVYKTETTEDVEEIDNLKTEILNDNVDEETFNIFCEVCEKNYPENEFETHNCPDIYYIVDMEGESSNSNETKKTKTKPDPNEKNERFVCKICNTQFQTYKSFCLHKRMHKPGNKTKGSDLLEQGESVNETDTFKCVICEKTYNIEFQKIHMEMHCDDPNFNCSVCNKRFTNEVNLKMHQKAHQEFKPKPSKSENDSKTFKYKCGYCGKMFARPHEKVKHERIHTGEKPYSCDICGKAFRVTHCLTLHMRTHTTARPYVCPHCNKRFKAHSVYIHHLMTHSNERPYQCTFCPKAFKTSVQLAGHKNSHTKPFSCNICNRPFATLYAVRSHMETHKKPNHNLKHVCNICGATYARSFALRDHLKEQHNQSENGIDAVDPFMVVDNQETNNIQDNEEILVLFNNEEENIVEEEEILFTS